MIPDPPALRINFGDPRQHGMLKWSAPPSSRSTAKRPRLEYPGRSRRTSPPTAELYSRTVADTSRRDAAGLDLRAQVLCGFQQVRTQRIGIRPGHSAYCAIPPSGLHWCSVAKIATAFVVFALFFQLGLGCGSVRAAAANDRNCCTTRCPAQSVDHAADCCQLSLSPQTALAQPSATQVPEIAVSFVSAVSTAPRLLASLAYSPRLSPAPPPPLIDVLCSRQI